MQEKRFIYLDYNATTPVDPRVVDKMLPFFQQVYANPHSSHLFGLSVRETVDETLEELALCLGGKPSNFLFTSGATEALNLAIKGLPPSGRKHIITVATEHKAVLDTCAFLENTGYVVTRTPVNRQGQMDLQLLEDSITEDTLMMICMLANNETGVLHPVKEVARMARQKGVWTVCDATQAVGKVPVNADELSLDILAFSAHKFYGPKGVGGLYLSDAAKRVLGSQIHGGGQQAGLRSGTLNVPGIIGMAEALRIAVADMPADTLRIGQLRDLLEEELLQIEGTFVNGDPAQRLYNTANLSFPGVNAEQLIMGLGTVSVSSGSACSSVMTTPSHVLTAMGLSPAEGLSSVRFSLGRFTTEEEIDRAIHGVRRVVSRLRASGTS